jgi:hypothetical protein
VVAAAVVAASEFRDSKRRSDVALHAVRRCR